MSRLGLATVTRGSRLGLVSDSLANGINVRLGLGCSAVSRLGLSLDQNGLGQIPGS